jgi:hypothetical protein
MADGPSRHQFGSNEERPNHFPAFIYDPGECEVLYTAERMSLDGAKSQLSIS